MIEFKVEEVLKGEAVPTILHINGGYQTRMISTSHVCHSIQFALMDGAIVVRLIALSNGLVFR